MWVSRVTGVGMLPPKNGQWQHFLVGEQRGRTDTASDTEAKDERHGSAGGGALTRVTLASSRQR